MLNKIADACSNKSTFFELLGRKNGGDQVAIQQIRQLLNLLRHYGC